MNTWETERPMFDAESVAMAPGVITPSVGLRFRRMPMVYHDKCLPKAPPRLRPREFRPLTPREQAMAEALKVRGRLRAECEYWPGLNVVYFRVGCDTFALVSSATSPVICIGISRKNPTDREDKSIGQLRALHRALCAEGK